MRIELTFISPDMVHFPRSYNSALQGLIYSILTPEMAAFLHDEGYQHENRKFKLFTFGNVTVSPLENRKGKGLLFSFILSSPVNRIIENLALQFMGRGFFTLNTYTIYPEKVTISRQPVIQGKTAIRMISPMTVYKTDELKRVTYFRPDDPEFEVRISANLQKKWEILNQKIYAGPGLTFRPVRIPGHDQLLHFGSKSFVKAWYGEYWLAGDPELIQVGYDAGLGSKNSMGLGLFEILSSPEGTV
ncbi:MAG: CRISPR-associated endoribonuclease Cas6 [Bacteroidetes bacterium]|nr:CRISPR-associated endoribonuclease Cas6 [Bacteroidota bacterium]